MNVTPEQKLLIQHNLRKVLKFKDTYEELYDHILTSLENAPANVSYEDAIKTIINDLGGTRGISAIEAKFKRIAIKDFFKMYLRYAIHSLGSAKALLIFGGTTCFYLCAKHNLMGSMPPHIAAWLLAMIPTIVLLYKKIKNNGWLPLQQETFTDTRSYIKGLNIGWFSTSPVLLLSSIIQIIYLKLILIGVPPINFGSWPATALFFIAIVHGLAIYDLYNDPFKTPIEN